MSAEVYKSKAEWLEKVMAADFTPATKVFAWAVFNRAYGDKITSHPGKNTIQKDTNLNPSKYKGYRDALVDAGALDAVQDKSPSGDWDNYRYTLNLEWGGTQRGTGCTPEGTTVVPTGSQGGTQRGTGVVPTGSSNTSIQDTKEDFKKDFKEDASVADAPEAANLDSHEPEETSDSDTSSEPTIKGSDVSTISEPSTTGTVDDSTSNESSTSEESIDLLSEVAATGTVVHGDSSTSEVLEIPAGSRSVPEHIGNPTTAAERSAYRKRILSQW